MSYTPTDWKSGDTITSEKLNKMEQGIADAGGSSGGGAFVVGVTFTESTATLDKTWQEIYDAVSGGSIACLNYEVVEESGGSSLYTDLITKLAYDDSDPTDLYYSIFTVGGYSFDASGANEYPSMSLDG